MNAVLSIIAAAQKYCEIGHFFLGDLREKLKVQVMLHRDCRIGKTTESPAASFWLRGFLWFYVQTVKLKSSHVLVVHSANALFLVSSCVYNVQDPRRTYAHQ